ncbi:hypothetical protein HKD37_02G004464 [Glycine soja]
MGEVEEIQEKIKADMEAMKEQMATMMAMMSMRKIIEANAVTIAATSIVAKVNPMPPSGLNQMNHPTLDMVGKDLGSRGGPHYAQNEHAFPPYGLPLNYTPPNVAYTPNDDPTTPNRSCICLLNCGGDTLNSPPQSSRLRALPRICHGRASSWWYTPTKPFGRTSVSPTTTPLAFHNKQKPSCYGRNGKTHYQYSTMENGGLHTFKLCGFGLRRRNDRKGEDEGEARAVTAIPIQPSFPPTQQCHYSANNKPSPYPPPTRKPVEFTPIPVSYANLLPYLLDNSMVAITLAKVHQPPFLREYDSNATCACHGEAPGHSVEHCRALKRKVQDVSNDSLGFPTSRVQSCWMTGPLDGPISCFLIKVDPWVLVPITFRGPYVLAIRGLHILACRGLHALAFRGLRVLIFIPGPPPDIGGRPTVRAHPEREAITHLLCIPGQDFPHAATKRRVRTMRSNMTTLTWMTLLFSNILPSDHNANLPLQMYQLGSRPQDTQWTRRSPTGPWGFQLWLRASVSPTGCPFPQQSHAIEWHPQRHPMDPEKSNRALGFPALGSRLQDTQWTRRSPTGSWSCQALITGLCQFYGVSVTSSKGIRPPTNRAFIKKYCVPMQAQGETPQQPGDGRQRAIDAPPSHLEFTSAHPQKG